eukprot:jgi/Tetstr1/427138/TSEL_017327.t1
MWVVPLVPFGALTVSTNERLVVRTTLIGSCDRRSGHRKSGGRRDCPAAWTQAAAAAKCTCWTVDSAMATRSWRSWRGASVSTGRVSRAVNDGVNLLDGGGLLCVGGGDGGLDLTHEPVADDARTEALYAGHARQCWADPNLFAALLVDTADNVIVPLVEGGELSRAAIRMPSKGMGDLHDLAIHAQLRDTHSSHGHPIPDAAYYISVHKAALTVDMPSQKHEHHVAADQRAAVPAVVDHMKEAYVSVLAPSQLSVCISAWDSVLIHDVRLIAEKLGPPQAVIVHTIFATLTTRRVDDRSAPLRSEDGVQQGAPLATTSFCVATHPEDEERNNTLETTCKAARFDVDDGYFVGLPEHVNPALHAYRTSIKASVGLEVSFGKMHAYTADMETVRREAPADIEWAEVHGDHAPQGGALAEAVDATVLTAVERVVGVSFVPSTYGTDTNPVGTDYLAGLLHDPDPMVAHAAIFSEDAVARARNMLYLPTTRLKGAGIRRMATICDAGFIG